MNFTKIFFGKIDNCKLKVSQNYQRDFWGFHKDFERLNEPINWEHGVFQYFSNSANEFWSTLTGDFKKNNTEKFIEVRNELIKIHNDFIILSDLIELISLNEGDIFDVKDDFDINSAQIEEEKDENIPLIDLTNHVISDMNNVASIWIFEVLRYDEVSYNIEEDGLDLVYKSSEDIKLKERFSFAFLMNK